MTDCMRTQQESEMTGTCLACKSIKMANHKTCIFCRQLANGMDILLAHCFAGVLHDWLSKTEMTEVNRLNDLEKSELVCHSHDFCDANMALLEGLKLLNIKPSIEYNCETEKNQCDAANEFEQRAWTIAKNAHFYVR